MPSAHTALNYSYSSHGGRDEFFEDHWFQNVCGLLLKIDQATTVIFSGEAIPAYVKFFFHTVLIFFL